MSEIYNVEFKAYDKSKEEIAEFVKDELGAAYDIIGHEVVDLPNRFHVTLTPEQSANSWWVWMYFERESEFDRFQSDEMTLALIEDFSLENLRK